MATTIREFVVELGVDADNAGLARFQEGVEKVKRGLTGLAQVAAAAAASATAVGGAMLAAANKAGSFSKKILEQSRAVGVATDTYQGLVFAARKYGQQARDVQDILSVLADRAEDATRGTSSFVEAFKLIGVEAKELKGLEPQQVLFKTADALANMEDATKRVTAAERLLGGELGQKFLPLLQKGSDGIQRLIDRADALGVVLGEQTLEQSRAVKRSFNEMLSIGRGLVLRLGADLAPAFQDVTNRLRDWLIANKELINQRLDEIVADLSRALRGFADTTARSARAADNFAQSVGGWVPLLEGITKAAAGLGAVFAGFQVANIISGLTTAFTSLGSILASTAIGSALLSGGLGSALGVLQLQAAQLASSIASFGGTISSVASTIASIGAGPILAVAAAAASILAIFEDLITFFQGGDSLTGQLVAWIKQNEQAREVVSELEPVLQGLMVALELAGQVFVEFGRTLSTLVVQSINVVIDATATLAKIIGRILKPVFTAIAGSISFVIDIFEVFIALIQGDLTGAINELKEAFSAAFGTIEDAARQSVKGLINSMLGALDFVSRTLERIGKVAGVNFDIPSLTKNLRVSSTEGGAAGPGASTGQPKPAPAPAPSTSQQGPVRSPLRVEDRSNNSYEVNVNAPNADAEEVAEEVDRRFKEKEQERARKRREELVKGGEA